MKRLIAALIVFVFTVLICIIAHTYVDKACNQTLTDIDAFYNNTISAEKLEHNWKQRKEKLSLFVNHDPLDKISIYMGELTLGNKYTNNEKDILYKNIQTVLSLIIADQTLAAHSFY